MSIGTPYLPILIPDATGPVIQLDTPAQIATDYGSGNIKTATKTFSIAYRNQIIFFEYNVPVVCDAGLIAALTAAGAPVV